MEVLPCVVFEDIDYTRFLEVGTALLNMSAAAVVNSISVVVVNHIVGGTVVGPPLAAGA